MGNICVIQFEYVSVDDDRICNLRFFFDLGFVSFFCSRE